MKKDDLKIGCGVSVCGYSDRRAFSIIDRTKNSLTLKRDIAKRLNEPKFVSGGFAGHCTNNHELKYEYKEDESGYEVKAFWSEKKGAFYVNKSEKVIEGRHEFYDYNF